METYWSKNRIGLIHLMGKMGIMLFLPIALFLSPISYLDNTPTICLIKNTVGYECLGCGMTHAIVSIFHGNLDKAIQYNWKVVIVLPSLVMVWGKQLTRLVNNFLLDETKTDISMTSFFI